MDDSLDSAVETALGARPPHLDTGAETSGEATPSPASPSAATAPADNAPVKRIDYHMWGTYILLVMIAIVELFSASIQEVDEGGIFFPIIRHGRFIIAGLIIMLILQAVHYKWIFASIPIYVLGSMGLMMWVHFGSGVINGAARAIVISGIPILPAEFMKLAVALGMAWLLTRMRDKRTQDISWWGVAACLLFLGACVWLLFSDGLSNTLIVMGIGGAMMFVGGMSYKKFLVVLVVAAGAAGVAYKYKTTSPEKIEVSERQARINYLNHVENDTVAGSGRGRVWNKRLSNHFRPNKWAEPYSSEHQQEQLSYIAQAHGGWHGVGIGKSRENARLPLAYSDYVYAIIVEESGLIGGLFILLIYMWILFRSARLTLSFCHSMPGLLVMGCAFVIVFQALYHMAIVSGVFPVSGQPLPMISKGGISVLATSMSFGIMLSCARHAVRNSDSAASQRKEHQILPASARQTNPATTENVEH